MWEIFIEGFQLILTSIAPILTRNKNHFFAKTTVGSLHFSQPIRHVLHQAVVTIVTTYWTWSVVCQDTKFTDTHFHQLGKFSLNGCQVFLVMCFIAKADTVVHEWMDGPDIAGFTLIADTSKFTDFS